MTILAAVQDIGKPDVARRRRALVARALTIAIAAAERNGDEVTVSELLRAKRDYARRARRAAR